ncbi:MAG: hypothetical protein EHM55_18195 [Acidobacteria bacterium]|nr:MAG: hypothetical protein EHM55_18195 [Acidobacteriota bacterium]
MKRLAILLTAISLPIDAGAGRAQPPSLSAARLHVSVEVDAHNVFIYRYSLENGAGSNAGIWKLTIDISLPAGASAPSAAGLAHGAGYFAPSSAAGRNPKADGAVPVALSAPQPGWKTTVGTDATARWVAQNTSLVFPKQRRNGFSLASHGPPALRRFSLAPYVDAERAPIMEPGDDPGELDRYQQEFDQYVESRSVVGTTLAPTGPVTVTADALLANLARQVVECRSLRWISNDAVTRSVTEKLQAARAAISRSQWELAVNILRALRNDVAAQSGKTLTVEAVALVDLNIQYTLPLVARR